MPRTLTITYPDHHREFWFTDQVLVPGDLLERDAGSWIVASVGVPNEAGKHTIVGFAHGVGLGRGRPTLIS